MAQTKSKPIITTEQRSLENQARIIKLEKEHSRSDAGQLRDIKRQEKKINKLQGTAERFSHLTDMHGGG